MKTKAKLSRLFILLLILSTVACASRSVEPESEGLIDIAQNEDASSTAEGKIAEEPTSDIQTLATQTPVGTVTAIPTETLAPTAMPTPTPELPENVQVDSSPPVVVSVSPANRQLTNALPQFEIQFNHTMNQESVAQALTVDPALDYQLTWVDEKLSLSLLSPLEFGGEYSLAISRNALNIFGEPIARAYSHQFSLLEAMRSVNKPSTGLVDEEIILYWNYPIDTTQLQDNFVTLSPPVAGEWVWRDSNEILEFIPAENYALSTIYTVELNGPFMSQDGQALPEIEPVEFVTDGVISRTLPGNIQGVSSHQISIVFNREMNKESAEAAFSIDPAFNGEFVWEDNTMIFRPEENFFGDDVWVTYELAPSVLTSGGEAALESTKTWQFKTQFFSALVDFGTGPNAQVLDANGARSLQFRNFSGQEREIAFNLYPLTTDQFIQQYANNFSQSAYWDQVESFDIPADLQPEFSWVHTTRSIRGDDFNRSEETFVPNTVPAGLYIAEIQAYGQTQATLFLALTANQINTKLAEGQVSGWVTDIKGGSVNGAKLLLIDAEGAITGEGVTDGNGVAKIDTPNLQNDADLADVGSYLVLAEKDGDVTITGLQGSWQEGGSWWWRNSGPTNRNQYVVYGYTERPIYKPGHIVYFKGIVRQDDDAELDIVPAGTDVTVRIRDARDNVVQTIPLSTNDFGTVNGSFVLGEGAMTGQYRVEFDLDGEKHSQIFKVEDFRKPEYEVKLATDQTQYVNGDRFDLNIQADYFIGEPVPNGAATIKTYRLWRTYSRSNSGPEYTWYNDGFDSGRDILLDENGSAQISLTAENSQYKYYWGSNLNSELRGIEVTVDDGSNQPVSSFVVIEVFNQAAGIEITLQSYFSRLGDPIRLNLNARTYDDLPLVDQNVDVTLSRWDYARGDYTTVNDSKVVKTDGSGQVGFEMQVSDPGYYRLNASGRDVNGNLMEYQSGVYVIDPNSGWGSWFNRGGQIGIEADKESYVAGEKALLNVESDFGGPALLTVERGTVRREMMVELTPPVTQVELPIIETDAPNIFVNINVYRENAAYEYQENNYRSRPEVTLYRGEIELAVSAEAKRLNVEIIPDQDSYGPGDDAAFTVKVTNAQGTPVSAELSMALVDDAIFALSEELAPPIFDGFYFHRDHAVQNFYSMAPIRFLGGHGGGGGGGGGAGDTINPRVDFKDTAAWVPVMTTDFNGEARLVVTLPDNLTRWRMTVKAATADTQVGQAVETIITTQPVQIRPILPRIVTAGDTVEISALIHNYTQVEQTLSVSFVEENGDLLTVQSDGIQSIILPPDGVQIVGWVTQIDQAGELSLRFEATAAGGGVGDVIILPLTAQPLAIPDVSIEIGEIAQTLNTTVSLPVDALDMSQTTVELSRSIAGSILQGLDDLTGYPYGCVEQTMSKALPNAVVGRALNQLGVDNPSLEADLPLQIGASIQKLYGFQHNDGGWGWWYDDDSQDYQTAWVLFGLANIVEAGYEVDPLVLEKGSTWLSENIESMDARTRAFALYSQSLAGYGQLETVQAAAGDLSGLDSFAIAALALAHHELGDRSGALALLAELENQAEIDGSGLVLFEGESRDGAYRSKTMASTVRNTSLVLSAFAQIQPGHELEVGMVRYLMSQKKAFGWGTTNETSFAILGLTDHLLASGFSESGDPISYELVVNGDLVESGELDRGQPSSRIVVGTDYLRPGENEITISHNGSKSLFYTLNSRTYLAQKQVEAAGPVKIEREYRASEGSFSTDQFVPGSLVRVTLRVTTERDASYVIIEDQLPAGLEPLNTNLNTASHDSQVTEYNSSRYFRWREFGYNRKEIRGNKISFFVTDLPTGTRTITYLARVTGSGTVTAMPTEAVAMYDETFWGRSSSKALTFNAIENLEESE